MCLCVFEQLSIRVELLVLCFGAIEQGLVEAIKNLMGMVVDVMEKVAELQSAPDIGGAFGVFRLVSKQHVS